MSGGLALAGSGACHRVPAATEAGPWSCLMPCERPYQRDGYGTAVIWGHDACDQAGQIIGQVAHPSARDELREAGRELGFRL